MIQKTVKKVKRQPIEYEKIWAKHAFYWVLVAKIYREVLGFPDGPVVKNSNAGDMGLIPILGRSPGEGNGTHSSILGWRIPWTEEPGRLLSMRSQDLDST